MLQTVYFKQAPTTLMPTALRFSANHVDNKPDTVERTTPPTEPAYEIIEQPNGVAPALKFTVKPGDEVHAERGAMLAKDSWVEMDTRLMVKGAGKVLKRFFFSGESIFKQVFTTAKPGHVTIAAPIPGKITAIDMSETGPMITQKEAFLAYTGDVKTDAKLLKGPSLGRRVATGFLGGEGFFLQRFEGTGKLFINASGNILEYNLKPGETLDVDNGCLVAYSDSIEPQVVLTPKLSGKIFSGEGLTHVRLSGPGKVFLQTMPFSRMALKIVAAGAIQGGGTSTGAILADSVFDALN